MVPFYSNRGIRLVRRKGAAVILTLILAGCLAPSAYNSRSLARGSDGRPALGDGSSPARSQTQKAVGSDVRPIHALDFPIHFEPNEGQTHPDVKFLSRGVGHTTFLTSKGAVFSLLAPKPPGGIRSRKEGAGGGQRIAETVRMTLLGGREPSAIDGMDPLPGRSNYIRGSDPQGWRTNIANFGKVRYRGVYPGIDLVYHGTRGNFEYDFIVAPGADPGRIKVSFGKARLSLTGKGDLVVSALSGASLRQPKPFVYQESHGGKVRVKGQYRLDGPHSFRFSIGRYDRSRPLVIDPEVLYSTYLGGSDQEIGEDIAIDRLGKVYITGVTASVNFPLDTQLGPGGVSGEENGSQPEAITDTFVAKIDPDEPEGGRASLIYSTILGGGSRDQPHGIAVDEEGHAYVTGITASDNFPLNKPWPRTIKKFFDQGFEVRGFLVKLNLEGSQSEYSIHIPGDGQSVAVDGSGSPYITGKISTDDLGATANAFQNQPQGGIDVFVLKLKPDGGSAAYATYIGGTNSDSAHDIAIGPFGKAYVGGTTSSLNYPVRNAFQPVLTATGQDPFLTSVNPDALSGPLSLDYSTYIGGPKESSGCPIPSTTEICEQGTAVAVDSHGNAYLAGRTGSDKFPVTPNAYRTTLAGAPTARTYDGFVAKFNPSLPGPASLVYSTYFGGLGHELIRSIAVEPVDPPTRNVYLAGITSSRPSPHQDGFPLSDAPDSQFGGSTEAFVAKLTVGGPDPSSSLVYSTYLGGSTGFGWRGWKRALVNGGDPVRCCQDSSTNDQGGEVVNGIAIDPSGSAFVVGTTGSSDMFSHSPNGFQKAKGTGAPWRESDAFVVKLGPPAPRPPLITGVSANSGTMCGGDEIKINGTNLWPPVTVEFVRQTPGGQSVVKPAQKTTVNAGATQINAVTPPHEAGPGEVVVKTATGQPAKAPFFYVPAICSAPKLAVPDLGSGEGEGGSDTPEDPPDDLIPTRQTGPERAGGGLNPPVPPPNAPAPGPVLVSAQAPVPLMAGNPAPGLTAGVSQAALLPAALPESAPAFGPALLEVAQGATVSSAALAAGAAASEAPEEDPIPAPRFMMSALSDSGHATAGVGVLALLAFGCCLMASRAGRSRSRSEPEVCAATQAAY